MTELTSERVKLASEESPDWPVEKIISFAPTEAGFDVHCDITASARGAGSRVCIYRNRDGRKFPGAFGAGPIFSNRTASDSRCGGPLRRRHLICALWMNGKECESRWRRRRRAIFGLLPSKRFRKRRTVSSGSTRVRRSLQSGLQRFRRAGNGTGS